MKFNSLAITLAVFASQISSCQAFTTPGSVNSLNLKPTQQTVSSTQLYIIGPMIRKMREEKEKKKMPMASADERRGEAEGLRVGTGAWKWPPVWPYTENDFTPKEDIPEEKNTSNPMAQMNMLAGNLPEVADIEEEEVKTLDVLNYWGEEKASEKTEIDASAVDKLKAHYAYYLEDGMTVLELGAAEESYLPDDLKLSRHVGVGANQVQMNNNAALTESLVVDLNTVVEEQGVDSDELKALGAGTFDAILMANTVDFLTQPREVFRSAWSLLKPGGIMLVPFTNREAYKAKFERAQTKMWRDMTDDQHMWICGSFFQFSASDGWENLKGFDISPAGAKTVDDGILSNLSGKKEMNMFVVQATKAYLTDEIDPENPEKSFASNMWLLPTLEERDKQLLAPRLARVYEAMASSGEPETEALVENVKTLPKVYESLVKMDQFSFPFGLQAQLATDLISDKDFNGNDEQITALKMGLGLRTPSPEFWALVGSRTSAMVPEDKVNLLAHIVPCFGSNDPEQEAALEAFVSGLEPTFAAVKEICPSMSVADVQLVGTELLAAEILHPGRSTKEEFAKWVSSFTESELVEMVAKRKSYKENALAEMKKFQEDRTAEEERIEGERKRMIEQIKKAREERTMVFNMETGKMEEMKP